MKRIKPTDGSFEEVVRNSRRCRVANALGKPDLASLPISRRHAVVLGETYFFTGVPCKRGHISKRSISNGCMQCYGSLKAKRHEAANAG